MVARSFPWVGTKARPVPAQGRWPQTVIHCGAQRSCLRHCCVPLKGCEKHWANQAAAFVHRPQVHRSMPHNCQRHRLWSRLKKCRGHHTMKPFAEQCKLPPALVTSVHRIPQLRQLIVKPRVMPRASNSCQGSLMKMNRQKPCKSHQQPAPRRHHLDPEALKRSSLENYQSAPGRHNQQSTSSTVG